MGVTPARGFERRLRADVGGDIAFDAFARGRYATDASHHQTMPLAVVAPKTIDDADRAIDIARADGVSVLARGGTSRSGQTVNYSLVLDCSKYLARILDRRSPAGDVRSSRHNLGRQ
jgi:FAD/FMN-containing dehydrogenase